MDFTMNGRVQARRGNRCAGDDRWVAIAVSSDEEWRALCRVMGNPPWTADERFSDQLNRWLNQDELDPLIEEWTRTRDCYEVMHTLQAAGGAAGAVLDNRDFPLDPHVKARDFFWLATRAETGTRPCYGSWQKLSKTPPALRMAAPALGQHNEQILSELLGLSRQEIEALANENIIATAPLGINEGPPPAWVVVPPAVMLQIGLIAAYDENYKAILGLPKDEIMGTTTTKDLSPSEL
jgi:crotonobetainyl-CoA:carnitine CoA-transferase CaiB-like acyl-CoA transferase